jgi:hypothetical protein
MQRRTRWSAATLGGAAPDTIIGRAAADRAGARPFRATRCENAPKCATPDRAGARPYQSRRHRLIKSVQQGFFAEMQSTSPYSGSNPRVLCLTRRRNVEFGCLQDGFLGQVHKDHGILVTDPVNMAW